MSGEREMTRPRAWSFIAMAGEQQYAGNRGYADEPRRVYEYDSNVANSRNVRRGDLALIRDRKWLRGIAQIESIVAGVGTKIMLRCPECGTVDLKERQTKSPRFRCDRGHEFLEPREDIVKVTKFSAHFENTFVETPDAISVVEMKAAAPRRSDQLSIEEIDISLLEAGLTKSYPKTHLLLARFYQSTIIDEAAAVEETSLGRDVAAGSPDSFKISLADTRNQVLRSIKERRGQQRFRNLLIKRYRAKCQISGCELIDLLEAAHIWPYRGEKDNHPENGLLLRADLHTLFDLNLMRINPQTLSVHFAAAARAAGYEHLEGRTIAVQRCRPAREPLALRWVPFE